MTNNSNDIFALALSLIDTLPLDQPTYTAPCLVGAVLSPAARLAAQAEAEELQDQGHPAPLPSESEVPELRALCDRYVPGRIDWLQELHDATARQSGTMSKKQRQDELRKRLLELQAGLSRKGTEL